jgi:hypothetical protein
MIKKLKEVGVVKITPYLKVVTLLANTVFLPWSAMLLATEYIREDAKNSSFDHNAIDALCDYWKRCINRPNVFGKR